jgi:4-hydroxybenzoate polyprenyltransferase
MILAGGTVNLPVLTPLLAALSFFYTGGMFLNDAFDQNFDRKFRPERPIPAGDIGIRPVYSIGFGLLALGELVLALPALFQGTLPDAEMMAWGLTLFLLIVYYNFRHKTDPLSPLVMALCRAMIYFISGAAVASVVSGKVFFGAALLVAYLVGLTYVAKQENLKEIKNLWPLLFLFTPALCAPLVLQPLDSGSFLYFFWLGWTLYAVSFLYRKEGRNIPRAVVSLIAGISLLDSLLIASIPGQTIWGFAAVLGFLLTLSFQRFIPGT